MAWGTCIVIMHCHTVITFWSDIADPSLNSCILKLGSARLVTFTVQKSCTSVWFMITSMVWESCSSACSDHIHTCGVRCSCHYRSLCRGACRRQSNIKYKSSTKWIFMGVFHTLSAQHCYVYCTPTVTTPSRDCLVVEVLQRSAVISFMMWGSCIS